MPLQYRIDGKRAQSQSPAARHRIAAPKFFAVPYNRLAEEGETVQFQCAVAGHPLPWSTWDRDGQIVMSSGRVTVKEHDDIRTLEIEHVQADDAGLYRITIENEFGRMEATARLDVLPVRRTSGRGTLRASDSPSGRRCTSVVTSSRRIMGASTRIGGRLVLAASYRGGSMPARQFYHNGEELQQLDDESGRVRIEHTADWSRLTIDEVRAEDAGLYTCLVQTRRGGMAASTTTVTLLDAIEDDAEEKCAKATAPVFAKPLHARQQCTEGTAIDLCCTLRHYERPFEQTWWLNGQTVPDSREFRYIDHGDGLLALRIADPFVFDSGEYTCRVRWTDNAALVAETSGTLEVSECNDSGASELLDEHSRVQFAKKPLPVMAFHGAVVTFCAKVWPVQATVQWAICGRAVGESTRGIMVSVGRRVTCIYMLVFCVCGIAH